MNTVGNFLRRCRN